MKLSELTDVYTPEDIVIPEARPLPTDIKRVVIDTTEPVYSAGTADINLPVEFSAAPPPSDKPSSFSSGVNEVLNKLFRDDEKRYQLWPEKVVREAVTAAGDVMSGKVPTWSVDPETGELTTSSNLVEKANAISALAGTGGLAGSGAEAGMALGIVPVDIAKKLKFKKGETPDILKQAVDNTPSAAIDADGHLVLKVGRNQHPDQEMSESVRGGVFYLPEGSKNARYYNGTTNNTYGGKQVVEGETAFVNPLVVKGATGGKAPETAYTQIMGKDAFKNLEKEIHDVITADIYKKEAPWMKQELTQKFLEKHAPELTNHADYILENSTKGNQLRYALQEAAVASAVRNAGYDGVVGYSVGRGANSGKPFLSEIYDVRENRYPSPSGDYSVHPELRSDSRVGAGVSAVGASSRGPFLRPALKHKDRLYKGKPGQEHQDIIPKELYDDFSRKAMSGEDLAEYNFGFINDKGHFLTREKALQYGIDTGIIDPHAGKFGALTTTLLADSSKPGMAIESMKAAQPFYSAVEHTVKNIPQGKMTGDQWLGTLSNKPGVKPEELDWIGLKDFLAENKGKPVTKQQIEDHIAANKVELKEVVKGQNESKVTAREHEEFNELSDRYRSDPDKLSQSEYERYLDLENRVNTGYDLNKTPDTKYHSYQLPGGENYREMLLTLPPSSKSKEIALGNEAAQVAKEARLKYGDRWLYDAPGEVVAKYDNLIAEANKVADAAPAYKSSHWDEPNILAHVRMNDRNIDGKKSLHLEEIQSDWHQQGRDKGYKPDASSLPKAEKAIEEVIAAKLDPVKKFLPPNVVINGKVEKTNISPREMDHWLKNDVINEADYKVWENWKNAWEAQHATTKVPDAPFKKSWHELALKRMLREAAEKGYDRLSWTPGEAQAARYDLSKQIDTLKYSKPEADATVGMLVAKDKNGGIVFSQSTSADKLADIVGKEAAKKLLDQKFEQVHASGTGYHELKGADLKIGGEGMKGFYDQIIPKALEKLGKEHGVKVQKGDIAGNASDWGAATDSIPPSRIYNADPSLREKYKTIADFVDHYNGLNTAERKKLIDKASKVGNTPVFYIDIPQSLKDTAMRKGFPLFSNAHPGYSFIPYDGDPFKDNK